MEMTPEQKKARELVEIFLHLVEYNRAKQCAIICCDEIIKSKPSIPKDYSSTIGWWQTVKQEIINLEV